MFSKSRPQTLLEIETDRAIRGLRNHLIGSPDYMKTMNIVSELHTMKEKEKPSSVSKDTLAVVGANLLGIILIIKHEHVNVITSRALNFVLKPR